MYRHDLRWQPGLRAPLTVGSAIQARGAMSHRCPRNLRSPTPLHDDVVDFRLIMRSSASRRGLGHGLGLVLGHGLDLGHGLGLGLGLGPRPRPSSLLPSTRTPDFAGRFGMEPESHLSRGLTYPTGSCRRAPAHRFTCLPSGRVWWPPGSFCSPGSRSLSGVPLPGMDRPLPSVGPSMD